MKAAHRMSGGLRWVVVVCATAWPCVTLVGCAVGGRSVSIDSNSRIPFFGLELKERPWKSDGPPLHSIRSGSKSDVRIEPIRLSQGQFARGRAPAESDAKREAPLPVPVPRTDLNLPPASANDLPAPLIDFR